MKKLILLSLLAVAGLILGTASNSADAKQCGKGKQPACPTTTVPSTTAISTTTTPTTTTEPTPANNCDLTLSQGGDLSTFVNSIGSGQVGCLHGGAYTDGLLVTWSASGGTLTEYPGEEAEIVGTELLLSGSNQIVKELTVRDVLCTDCDGISSSGSGSRIEHNLILRIARHGILLHTSSTNTVVTRNFVDSAGVDSGAHSTFSPSQIHGIYVQGSGHQVTRNVFTRMTGYGIHLYSSPSNILVSGNTAIASETRTGILIRTTGTGNVITNNIFEGGTIHSCGGCVIDTNQVAGDWSFQDPSAPTPTNTIVAPLAFADSQYHLAASMPGRNDVVWPDRDGVNAPVGSPDLGAYEFVNG